MRPGGSRTCMAATDLAAGCPHILVGDEQPRERCRVHRHSSAWLTTRALDGHATGMTVLTQKAEMPMVPGSPSMYDDQTGTGRPRTHAIWVISGGARQLMDCQWILDRRCGIGA